MCQKHMRVPLKGTDMILNDKHTNNDDDNNNNNTTNTTYAGMPKVSSNYVNMYLHSRTYVNMIGLY